LVAAELVPTNDRSSLTARRPWLVAFTFGLLHGFGFAGALNEVGLPQNAIPLALFFFNAGVELGQLVFVVAVLTFIRLLSRLLATGSWSFKTLPNRLELLSPYAIGSIAAYWFIKRIVAF
jgi:HupE/UreJ protein